MRLKKESALKEDNITKLKENGKHLYTVSMYFMGVLMRDMFENKIINRLGTSLDNYKFRYRYDFTYTWFITCLFHDFSWIHEDNKISKNYSDPESCFKVNLIKKFGINNSIFNHRLVNGNYFATYYNSKTIINYFYYIHGVIKGERYIAASDFWTD